MKRNRPFIFLLTLLLILMIVNPSMSNGLVSGEISFEDSLSDFSLRVDSDLNETIYYLSASNRIIEFSIQSNNWGIEFGDGYRGLLIELIFDVNHSTLNSWLILSGDLSIHHFTSEIEMDGVVQIKFSALRVDSIDFELVLSDDYPVWTYETHINAFDRVFFGVERNAEYYLSIEKIVLHLATRNVVSLNYTCKIYNEMNQSIITYSGNFSYSDLEVVEIVTEEGMFEEHWYKLRFYTEDYSSTQIKCVIFYDHHQTENIGRIFLNKGNQVISDIPIDSIRSTPSFYWTILDTFTPPPPPPPFPNPLIFIMIAILAFLSFIFILIVVIGIRVNYKKKRMGLDSATVQPSDKYHQMQTPRAEYSPAQIYGVNFAEKILDYNIETFDEIKVTCSICLQIIDDQDNLIRCPSCDIAFHKNHLYQWIVGNGTCPACKSRLKITEY